MTNLAQQYPGLRYMGKGYTYHGMPIVAEYGKLYLVRVAKKPNKATDVEFDFLAFDGGENPVAGPESNLESLLAVIG